MSSMSNDHRLERVISHLPKGSTVTFDFDQTLALERWDPDEEMFVFDSPNHALIALLRRLHAAGHVIHIVTSRRLRLEEMLPWASIKVSELISWEGLPVQHMHFTNHAPKRDTLQRLGSVMHFDDNDDELMNLPDECIGVKVCDDGSWVLFSDC